MTDQSAEIARLDHEHFWERDVCQICGLDREGRINWKAEWEATSILRIRDHTEIARLTALLDMAREALGEIEDFDPDYSIYGYRTIAAEALAQITPGAEGPQDTAPRTITPEQIKASYEDTKRRFPKILERLRQSEIEDEDTAPDRPVKP